MLDQLILDDFICCEQAPLKWSLQEAIDLCKKIEAVCPDYGCHVALTGGILYKDGPRKDLDLLFYRIRQVDKIDEEGLMKALDCLGIIEKRTHGWVTKATYQDKNIDLFFPERKGSGTNEYQRKKNCPTY